jgi:hypothetical protein
MGFWNREQLFPVFSKKKKKKKKKKINPDLPTLDFFDM